MKRLAAIALLAIALAPNAAKAAEDGHHPHHVGLFVDCRAIIWLAGVSIGGRGIPGQPAGNPDPGTAAADGITDLLTAFWFSKKSEHHGKHHFAPGVAAQFPTASDDTLGSGRWSFGPSFDYEYESGRWFAGAIALQVWSVAGDEDRKSVNMLMIKPFAYYSVSEH